MAETKKPAAKSAAVKTTKTTAASKPAKVAEKKASTGSKKPAQTTRLYEMYNNEIKKQLVEKFKYTSVMQAPKLEKVVINIGVGDALTDNKALDAAVKELAQITGQHPVTTKAKKSIATFKLRQGQEIGCKVTLRGIRMYEFMDRLISIALPRVRDFRGVSKNSFDGHGNYTLGIKEQLIFPEIEYDKVSKVRGMDIVVVTTANTDEEAYALLDMLGMPFHK